MIKNIWVKKKDSPTFVPDPKNGSKSLWSDINYKSIL